MEKEILYLLGLPRNNPRADLSKCAKGHEYEKVVNTLEYHVMMSHDNLFIR
jgi:hypothetical protein